MLHQGGRGIHDIFRTANAEAVCQLFFLGFFCNAELREDERGLVYEHVQGIKCPGCFSVLFSYLPIVVFFRAGLCHDVCTRYLHVTDAECLCKKVYGQRAHHTEIMHNHCLPV